jgi:hypothetical protein
MKEAFGSASSYKEAEKKPKENKPLFPHPELKVTLSSVADVKEPKPKEVIEDAPEESHISVAEDTVTTSNGKEMAYTTPTTVKKPTSRKKSK